MNKFNHIHLRRSAFLLVMLVGVIPQLLADETLGSGIDCSNVSVNYVDNPEWTYSERLEAMDKAFFESVDRFELCNLSSQSSSSSASAGGGNQASSTGSEAGLDSVASAIMEGTETESTLPPMASSEGSEASESTDESTDINGAGAANGAIPEDIPAADNDDVIAAQIRLAAEIEQDPVKKQKLWNEYRKYKGLPANDNE